MDFTTGLVLGAVCGALFASTIAFTCYLAVQVKREESFKGARLTKPKPVILDGEDKTRKFIDENFDYVKENEPD